MLDQSLQQAAWCIPQQLRTVLSQLNLTQQKQCEEIRLRVGQPLCVTICGQEKHLRSDNITQAELEQVLQKATEYSMHTFADSLRQGFLTVQGGHRIGVCGQMAMQNGHILSYRRISSLNIRIARQMIGIANETLYTEIRQQNRLHSILIFSPPGRGKTTVLRDLARQISNSGIRTAFADERSELAGIYEGVPQFDIGQNTDVIDGCSKAQAAMILLKTMSPQLLVLDEITSENDIHAVEYAAHCGVAVLASAHAWDLEDFTIRPLYRKLLEMKVFDKIFCIQSDRSVQRVQ